MPPLNPNWASLPGTKFEADPGGLQVAQAFLPYALQDAKAKAATKAADVAQKKADAEKVLGREVLPVAEWDIPVYQGLVKDYRKMAQDAFRMRDANPGNPAFDPMNPTSEAYNKLKDAEDALTQFQVGSAQRGKDWTAAILSYDPTKDSPADLEEKRRYYQSLTGEHMAGKVPQPVLLGNYAPEAVYNDAVSKLKTDQTAYAKPGEPGYLIEGTTEVLSDDAVKEAAFNIAHEPRQAKMTAMRIEAMPETQRTQLIKEAEANGKTPVEWLTWLDMDEKAGTKTTRGIESDPTFNHSRSAGWGNDDVAADRWVKYTLGVTANNPEVFTPIYEFYSGEYKQGTKGIMGLPDKLPDGANAVFQGYKGLKVGKSDGKDLYVTFGTRNGDGTISLYASTELGTSDFKKMRKVLHTNQGDFASDVVEMMTEANEELKKPAVEKKLKEYGVVRESGDIQVKSTNPYNQPAAKPKKF